ncbi:hypothetical protein Tco_0752142 [Tanacetum coccineum]|uniref:Uncharacterized protein n=1 Tax=Tanacetum coccineum TaxID=301880 RepID=A0ABQ4Z7N8_9ASTR
MFSQGNSQLSVPLPKHFGLLTEERLQGLIVVVRDLLMIDIDELVRLWICDKLGETWVWVAPGLEKEQVVAAEVAQVEQEIYEEGVQAEPAPVQAPLAAAPAPGTMP